jgi:putative oxidoreductase
MTTPRDFGLLALRLGIGGTLVAHGTQKLFGWFGGAGLEKTAAGAALALTGPGTLSIDHVLGHRLNQPWMRSLALAAVVPAAFAVLARRRRAVAAEDISTPAEPEATAPDNSQPACCWPSTTANGSAGSRRSGPR